MVKKKKKKRKNKKNLGFALLLFFNFFRLGG
jgi:hypothetical protein